MPPRKKADQAPLPGMTARAAAGGMAGGLGRSASQPSLRRPRA
jgi:hypothetical protein